jgi:hypothetical protein
MSEHDYDDHTAELKRSRAEAEKVADALRDKGWEVYPEKVPLAGQWGYYCVNTWHDEDGSSCQRAHSVRWNLYDQELHPVVINCRNDRDLLSFIWTHGTHEGFDHFEYGDGDVGFVCYCQGQRGKSLVLRVGQEIDEALSEESFELLWMYENQGSQAAP